MMGGWGRGAALEWGDWSRRGCALGIGDLEGGPQSEDYPFSPQNSSLGLSEAWARGGWEGTGRRKPSHTLPI